MFEKHKCPLVLVKSLICFVWWQNKRWFFGMLHLILWFSVHSLTLIYKTNSLTLAFGHVTWTSIGVISLLGASTLVTSLGSFQWRGQEILSGHFFQRPDIFTLSFDHDTSKSIEVIFFLMASFVPNLATFQQSGQEILDIERTSLGLQTDRPTERPTDRYKTISAPFSKKKPSKPFKSSRCIVCNGGY